MRSDLMQLIERARSVTRDSDSSYVTPEDYTNYANEAITDLGARLELFDDERTTTATGLETYGFPTDVDVVEPLHLYVVDVEVEWVDDVTFDAWKRLGNTPTGTLGRIFERQFELYPAPAAGTTLKFRFKRLAGMLQNGSDLHELPLQLESKVVAWMKFSALMKLGRTDDASAYYTIYNEGLPSIDTGKRASMPLPLQIQIEPGPFDLDVEAQHI